ncbi:kinase-like domain-containing protein [Leptodontidium sp. MPI-SDFR-AT-0119]|nr:kinase-like domain-containing protein [Leptodontidium sp. MPI-SDFR-AT-0119]
MMFKAVVYRVGYEAPASAYSIRRWAVNALDSCSTVWLAWDGVLDLWVSIKVKSADSTEHSRELGAFQVLQETAASHHIVRQLDDFVHQGPNGCHQCLTFELLGPSVDNIANDYREGGDQLDPETILKITTQLLQAISSIHAVGYAHGDISGSNLAFTCPRLAHLPQHDIFEVIGLPESENLVRIDGQPLGPGVPKQLVRKADWDNWIDEDDEDIRLIDFGEAFVQGSKPGILAQPADLRAPETIFTDRFDYRLDLWRAGITIYSSLFGSRPFQHWGDVDTLVLQMINFVEELPAEWQPQWELMRKTAGGMWENLATNGKLTESKLEQKFHDRIHEPTLQPLLPVIRGLTRFRPSDRISAAEALEMIGSCT